jgi:predicted aldo/keto reductase-like oxidoreductase
LNNYQYERSLPAQIRTLRTGSIGIMSNQITLLSAWQIWLKSVTASTQIHSDQLNKSLANLGIETIDVYYIHNPEKQLAKVEPDIFYNQLRTIFEVMEDAV